MKTLSNSDAARLARIRSRARREGLTIRKSRSQAPWPTPTDQGQFMVWDPRQAIPVGGAYFDFDISDLEKHFAEGSR